MEFTKEQKEFFDNHSKRMVELAYDFDRHEKVFRPDGFGKGTTDCGDTIAISLTTMKKVIQFVSLEVEGCVYTNACANAVAQLVEGRTIDQAIQITPEQVANYLESLPEDSFHCAELATSAMIQAVLDYKRKPITNH